MMQHLLRRLVFDVPLLNEHTKMPLKVIVGDIFLKKEPRQCHLPLPLIELNCEMMSLSLMSVSQLLTNHYERCWKYYCLSGGWGSFGAASDEELHLTRKLFWGVFDALARKVPDCNLS